MTKSNLGRMIQKIVRLGGDGREKGAYSAWKWPLVGYKGGRRW